MACLWLARARSRAAPGRIKKAVATARHHIRPLLLKRSGPPRCDTYNTFASAASRARCCNSTTVEASRSRVGVHCKAAAPRPIPLDGFGEARYVRLEARAHTNNIRPLPAHQEVLRLLAAC